MRLKVVGPFMVYLVVFALWFAAWSHSPTSIPARVLGSIFAGMTLILCGAAVLARISPFFLFIVEFYDTFIKESPPYSESMGSFPAKPVVTFDAPKLVITKRMKDGTPIRAECPVCECEFSTEAFDTDPTYPHEQRLETYYSEHFADHFNEMQ